MSSLLLPLVDLGAYIDGREPTSEVQVDKLKSGKTLRSTYQTSLLTQYTVKQERLRSDAVFDYQRWLSWFKKHFGQLDSFLLDDPEDDSVTDHGFAVGDGSTTAFQLQRTTAGSYIDAGGNLYNQCTKPYTNSVKNSSFEFDSNGDGLADNWIVYNNSTATEPAVATIVPGVNGGKAQRIAWGTNSTNTKGVAQSGVSFVAGQWYTLSGNVRASPGNVGKFIGLGWNAPPPSTTIAIACPPLAGSYQRYVFQVFWNVGLVPVAGIFISISGIATGTSPTSTATFGYLDFDLIQVTPGQWGLNDLQPVETPAASGGTDLPALWPNSYTDGYGPIFDTNGDTSIFQDGDWMGRRQLFPFARTNLIGNSAAIDTWTKAAAFVTANATTAPDGTTTGDLVAEGNPTAAPTLNTLTPSTTGGTLAAGTYFIKVSAFNANGEESLPSGELSTTTTGSTGSIAVAWSAATGAVSYRVYIGTATGAENQAFGAGAATSFTVTTATGSALSPLTSTAVPHTVADTTVPNEAAGELRCLSIFLKANTLQNLVLRGNGGNDGGIKVNLGTGAIDGTLNSGFVASGVQSSPLWNGWLRFWVVTRAPAAQGSHLIIQGCPDATYATTGYTGTGRTFSAWGAQCERVSDLNGPSPYIPTPTSAAVTVTDYTLSTTGLVTLAAALPAPSTAFPATFLSWTGKYYIRVRLDQGSLPLARIVLSMWSTGLRLVEARL